MARRSERVANLPEQPAYFETDFRIRDRRQVNSAKVMALKAEKAAIRKRRNAARVKKTALKKSKIAAARARRIASEARAVSPLSEDDDEDAPEVLWHAVPQAAQARQVRVPITWHTLADDAKLKIMARLPNKDRRSMMRVSRKDRELVSMLRFRSTISIDCRLCHEQRRWYCDYDNSPVYGRTPNIVWFDDWQEAFSHMLRVISTADKVKQLKIDFEENQTLLLTTGRNILNVEEVVLRQIGDTNNGVLAWYHDALMQFDPKSLRSVKILKYDQTHTNCKLGANFYEKQKTYFNLENLTFHGIMDVGHILDPLTRVGGIDIMNGSEMTRNEMMRLVLSLVVRTGSDDRHNIFIQHVSTEMQIYLLGSVQRRRDSPIRMRLNTPRDGFTVTMIIHRGARNVIVELDYRQRLHIDNAPFWIENATRVFRTNPSLNTLFHELESEMPARFALMFTGL